LFEGCASVEFAHQAGRTSEKLAGMKRLGATTWAPYEMTLAEAYLQKAAEEAAEADYEHALDLARDAETLLDGGLRRAPRSAR
jgi:hypothetical protein